MRSVMLEQFEASVCNPLNLLRESVIMGPEIVTRSDSNLCGSSCFMICKGLFHQFIELARKSILFDLPIPFGLIVLLEPLTEGHKLFSSESLDLLFQDLNSCHVCLPLSAIYPRFPGQARPRKFSPAWLRCAAINYTSYSWDRCFFLWGASFGVLSTGPMTSRVSSRTRSATAPAAALNAPSNPPTTCLNAAAWIRGCLSSK
jgi:hypothetical protein